MQTEETRMSDQIWLCDLSLAPNIGMALGTPGRRPETVKRVNCTTAGDFDAAVHAFLAEAGQPDILGAALAARGWEYNGELHLAGLNFAIDRQAVRQLLGVQRVNFVNNFVARALAVPGLRRDEKSHVTGGEAHSDGVIAVMGPHFGLGLAGLVSDGVGGMTALHGEGGHADLPAGDEREWRLIQAIRARTGYVSREDGISVAGLTNIWHALHALSGERPADLTAPEIIAAAKTGDARAQETLDVMIGWLGAMASDIALVMGATGGVYLTGALLDMMGDVFDMDKFAARYGDKGPLSGFVRDIPVFRTLASEMEIRGLATLYD